MSSEQTQAPDLFYAALPPSKNEESKSSKSGSSNSTSSGSQDTSSTASSSGEGAISPSSSGTSSSSSDSSAPKASAHAGGAPGSSKVAAFLIVPLSLGVLALIWNVLGVVAFVILVVIVAVAAVVGWILRKGSGKGSRKRPSASSAGRSSQGSVTHGATTTRRTTATRSAQGSRSGSLSSRPGQNGRSHTPGSGSKSSRSGRTGANGQGRSGQVPGSGRSSSTGSGSRAGARGSTGSHGGSSGSRGSGIRRGLWGPGTSTTGNKSSGATGKSGKTPATTSTCGGGKTIQPGGKNGGKKSESDLDGTKNRGLKKVRSGSLDDMFREERELDRKFRERGDKGNTTGDGDNPSSKRDNTLTKEQKELLAEGIDDLGFPTNNEVRLSKGKASKPSKGKASKSESGEPDKKAEETSQPDFPVDPSSPAAAFMDDMPPPTKKLSKSSKSNKKPDPVDLDEVPLMWDAGKGRSKNQKNSAMKSRPLVSLFDGEDTKTSPATPPRGRGSGKQTSKENEMSQQAISTAEYIEHLDKQIRHHKGQADYHEEQYDQLRNAAAINGDREDGQALSEEQYAKAKQHHEDMEFHLGQLRAAENVRNQVQ